MKVRRGDVVIIDHPFSDGRGSKVRPALVVQSDARNSLLQETSIALISTKTANSTVDTTQLLIDLGTPDGQATGLRSTSVVKGGKLFTIHENLVRKRIGVLSPALVRQFDHCLKQALELP